MGYHPTPEWHQARADGGHLKRRQARWCVRAIAGAPHALQGRRLHGRLGTTPARRLLRVGRGGPCEGTSGGGHQVRPNAVRSQTRRGHHKWPVPTAAQPVACAYQHDVRGERRVRVARDGRQPSTRMRARLRAQHHSGGRRQGGQQHVVAEEKVASTRRMALPSRSPLSELDVRISLRRARCGGSLQPSATSSDLLSSAARKQAAACSPDRARGKGRAACGEDRERIGPSCPVSRRGSANRLGEAQPTRVCREEGAVSRRAGNVLGRLPQASLQSAPYSRVMRRGLRFVERWGDRAERVVGTGCRAVAQEEPGTRKSGICGAQGDEPMFRQRLVAAPVQECHEGFTFTESCAGPLQTLVLPQCGSRFFLCIFFGFFWVFFLVFGAWMVENVEQSQGWASRRGCTVLFWVFFLVLPSLVLKTLHHSARPSYDTFTHLSHSRRRSF